MASSPARSDQSENPTRSVNTSVTSRVCRTPRHAFGQRLPDLQAGQAHLPRRGVTIQQPIGGAGGGPRPTDAVRRQRIPEVRVAGQRAASAFDEGDDSGTVVGALQPPKGSCGADAPGAWLGRTGPRGALLLPAGLDSPVASLLPAESFLERFDIHNATLGGHSNERQ